MTCLHIDFETRSAVDLKKTSTYVYAVDPTTDVWCAAYAFDEGPIDIWTRGEPCPPEIVDHVKAGGEIAAYNSNFERIIWKAVLARRHGWPEPKLEQFRCVMAEALAMALPGSLENASAALGLELRKDMAGRRVMLKMAKPRRIEDDGTIVWWDDPDLLTTLYAYCKQDVATERALEKRLFRLSEQERKIFFLDARINDRGVKVDIPLCRQAAKVIDETTVKLDQEMRAVTGNEVASCSTVKQLVAWLKTQGVDTDSVAKDQLIDMLADIDLPPGPARRALELRQEAAKSSTAKIESLILRVNDDNRMRGNLQYHGAGTGRWAARGAQLQNLPRSSMKIGDEHIRLLARGSASAIEMLYDRPLTFVSDCIRSMLIAEDGKKFIAGDFSQIEARVLAWLAGQKDLLELFRNNGPVYETMAAAIYGKPVADIKKDSPERQIGKVTVLGAGFGMGARKFRAQTKKQVNIQLTQEQAEAAIGAYREKNTRITAYWRMLEEAVVEAVRNPGQIFSVGRVKYKKAGSFLWCQLPSGRTLCYPYPRLVRNIWTETIKADKATVRYDDALRRSRLDEDDPDFVYLSGDPFDAMVYKGVDPITKRWGDKDGYGGLYTENVVQAVARDLMAEAMLRLEAAGYPLVLTVHDEEVAEPPETFGSVAEFVNIMVQLPAWAAGCPVAAEAWEGKRYRK